MKEQNNNTQSSGRPRVAGPVFAALFAAAAASSGGASAEEVYGSMRTKWAEEVPQDQPLPEYPRPQMVRESWTNLNGQWDYAIVAAGSAKPERWEGKILVPFAVESQLSGVGQTVGADNALWYRRTFERPAGERVLLHFGAVDWRAKVSVNGREVGSHEGGFTPFSFDITDALAGGDEQELVVHVWDPTDAEPQPRGKQVREPGGIFYTAVTGIWQTVWLEGVPAASISGVLPTPDVDGGKVTVEVEAEGAAAGDTVRVTASHGGGEVGSATGAPGSPIDLAVPDAKLWSPDSPHLYDLKVELVRGGEVADSVESYFAMRKISFGKGALGFQRMLLNDEVVFQFGPLDQGWWPDGLYTAPTDEALKYDIEVTKEMGFNMARKHVKVEPARWYYWTDKLGLLVWQDMPSGFNDGGEQNARSGSGEDATMPDEWSANFRRELEEMIDAFRFFPSIVVWVPFNEGWGQHKTNEILEWTMEYDPTRLVGGPSGWEDLGAGHLKDMHAYPGPNMFPVLDDRVSVLGEFGGLGLPVDRHLWWDKRNWGYRTYETKEALESNYERVVSGLRPLIDHGLAAAVYTQTTDVEGEVNGLLTYDRAVVKLDTAFLKRVHDPLYEPAARRVVTPLVPTAESGPVEWRFTTTAPDGEWTAPEYEASGWKTGPAGFGEPTTPNTHVRTGWKTDEIWLRRTFELGEVPASGLHLRVHHDEDAEVYVNGTKVLELAGYTTAYIDAAIPQPALDAFKAGENTLAVHVRQTGGGQYFDAGFVTVVREEP